MIASEEDDENSADDDQISLSTNDLTEQASIGTLTPLQDFFNLLTFERLQHTNTLSPSSSSSYKNHSGTTQIAIEESGLKTQQQFWNSQDIFNNHQYNNSLGAIAELPSPNPKYLDGSGTENIRKSKTADSASMWGWFVLTDDK